MIDKAFKTLGASVAGSPSEPVLPRKARVFIVEDHPVVRQAMCHRFNSEPDLAVCGQADQADDAFQQIVAVQPDIAIVDLTLKQGSGLDLIPLLRQACPATKILVFSMHYESFHITKAMRSGADAYVPKEEGLTQVVSVIRQLLKDCLWAPIGAPNPLRSHSCAVTK